MFTFAESFKKNIMKLTTYSIFILVTTIILLTSCQKETNTKKVEISKNVNRVWLGSDFWANRLQDWQLNHGTIECINATLPRRTVHLITYEVADTGNFKVSCKLGPIRKDHLLKNEDWCGIVLGLGNDSLHYKSASLVQSTYGNGSGWIIALNGEGSVLLSNSNQNDKWITPALAEESKHPQLNIYDYTLEIATGEFNEKFALICKVLDGESGDVLSTYFFNENEETPLKRSDFQGHIAMIANNGKDASHHSFAFSNLELGGSGVLYRPDRAIDPVIATMYTLHNNILKMTAQAMPLGESAKSTAILEVTTDSSSWSKVAESNFLSGANIFSFRVENWNSDVDYQYRVVYKELLTNDEKNNIYYYYGKIRKNPKEQKEIKLANLGGNQNSITIPTNKEFSFLDSIYFPHQSIVENLQYLNPDILSFVGDQVTKDSPTEMDKQFYMLDYLYKWYIWCWSFREITKDRPTICLPDDQDVFQTNLWGMNGIKADEMRKGGVYPMYYSGYESYFQEDRGGYCFPSAFVNMVEQTQTKHLPDPIDPAQNEHNIKSFFTNMNYGDISFAIVECKKYRSSPASIYPSLPIVNGYLLNPIFDNQVISTNDATILGKIQKSFLSTWINDFKNSYFKVYLGQLTFSNLQTVPDSTPVSRYRHQLPCFVESEQPSWKSALDFSSGAWPIQERNEILNILRQSGALVIGGDNYLPSLVHYGIDNQKDAVIGFTIPAIAKTSGTRWYIKKNQPKKNETSIDNNYLDGFGNRMSILAVANAVPGKDIDKVFNEKSGFGLVTFNKTSGIIVIQALKRNENLKKNLPTNMEGYPFTFLNKDLNQRKTYELLPTLRIVGFNGNPVIQIIDEFNNEIISTQRIYETVYQPKVYKKGKYTVNIGEPSTSQWKVLKNVQISKKGNNPQEEILVRF